MGAYHMPFLLSIFIINISNLDGFQVIKYPLLMPNVRPNRPELYICTPVKVNYTRNYYITTVTEKALINWFYNSIFQGGHTGDGVKWILLKIQSSDMVGFEPNATMNTAHHILLYGCSEPGSVKPVWDCGEMSNSDSSLETSSPCREGSQIIYAWARDAPMLTLPKDVGFKVGGDSQIRYLVLQVHYAHIEKFKDGSTDDSGVFLHYTERAMPKLAGVILLGTGGFIPPMAEEHMESACIIRENKTIHPFAFRTHTHSLGKLVSGYKVQFDKGGDDTWTLLGKKDPMLPEMFYPVTDNSLTISHNDGLAARCTMESRRMRPTYIGATNKDEMCNFYLMYWVDGDSPLDQKYCFTMGPPYYNWRGSGHFHHIPDKDASSPY